MRRLLLSAAGLLLGAVLFILICGAVGCPVR